MDGLNGYQILNPIEESSSFIELQPLKVDDGLFDIPITMKELAPPPPPPQNCQNQPSSSFQSVAVADNVQMPPPPPQPGPGPPTLPPDDTKTTINFTDFVSLLSPSSVESCLCCSTSLLTNGPPSKTTEKRTEILKSFCDILNLPFSLNNSSSKSKNSLNNTLGNNRPDGDDDDDEEGEEQQVDFPFCFQCTNQKILVLTMVHEKLEILQKQFEEMKNNVIKDILRVFVTNMIREKKLPVEVIRDARISQRMFHLFKRHTERKAKQNSRDSETQTVVVSAPQPPGFAEPQGSGNKRRRVRKTESQQKSTPDKKVFSNADYHHTSPAKTRGGLQLQYDEIPPHQMNGHSYPFDEHGVLEMGLSNDSSYIPGVDFNSYDSKTNYTLNNNGFYNNHPSYNNAEYVPSMGFDNAEEGAFSVEVPMQPVIARKSSPHKNYDDDTTTSPVPKKRSRDRNKEKDSQDRMASCEICQKRMLKTTIKMHMDQIHGDEKPYQCRGCDKRFARRDHFRQHEERHLINSKRFYYCHRCGDDSELICSKGAYVEHCITDHGIEDDVVEYFHFCDFEECQKSYKVREDFTNHIKSHWNPGDSFRCSVCEKIFSVQKRLTEHEKEAHKNTEPFYDCQFCYNGFEVEENFTWHSQFHKVKIPEEFEHACTDCGKTFETITLLRRHIYLVHKLGKGAASVSDDVANDSSTSGLQKDEEGSSSGLRKKMFVCKDCGKVYTQEKRFQKHRLKHSTEQKPKNAKKNKRRRSSARVPDPEDEDEDDEDEDQHSEPEEEPDEDDKNDIAEEGEEDEEEPEEQDVDEDEDFPSPRKKGRKKNTRIGRPTRSTRSVVTGSGHQACLYCPRRWRSSHEARRHMAMTHRTEHLAGNKKFCIVCFFVFDNAKELDEHCEEKHSKFRCQECGTQCTNSIMLNQHLKRHSGAQPFMCQFCSQGFLTNGNLQKHISTSHKKSASTTSNNKKMSTTATATDNENNDDMNPFVEDEDLEDLKNTLTPVNDLHLLNHDQESYGEMLDLFQL